jgi:cyclase
MLKTRIIPTLLCRGRELVKGERFNSWRRVGNTLQAARVHNMREVDELAIINVAGCPFDVEDVRTITRDTFMPVSIGGGVRTLMDAWTLLGSGADKIVINTAAIAEPTLIGQMASKFGSQSVVVSIDVRNGHVWSRNGTTQTDWSPGEWAARAEGCGAGEILLTSIDNDGTLRGYDLDLVQGVSASVRIPVIAAGGAGCYEDFAKALDAGAHAVAAGAMFIFTDQTPQGAARYLHEKGYQTRIAA